jgi:hypothetical protein
MFIALVAGMIAVSAVRQAAAMPRPTGSMAPVSEPVSDLVSGR